MKKNCLANMYFDYREADETPLELFIEPPVSDRADPGSL